MRRAAHLLLPSLLLLLSAGGCSEESPERPPVVLVVFDSLRDDFTGADDEGLSHTPALDTLAAGATRFAKAWATAPTATASLASMLSGRLPGDDAPSVITRMAESGYECACFCDSSLVVADAPLDDFDIVSAQANGPRTLAEMNRFLAGREAAGETTPLFLLLHFSEAASPWDPPADYRRLHLADLPPDTVATDATAVADSSADWSGLRRLYAGDVNLADRLLRVVLEALGLYGLDGPESCLIVTSSHGVDLGDLGRVGNGDGLAETLLDVPLVVRAPARLAAGERTDPVMLLDVAPTILTVARLPLFENNTIVPARSLSAPPAATAQERDLIALRHDAGRPTWRSIRRGGLRLTITPSGEWLLHDVATDPHQQYNVRVRNLAQAKNLGARLQKCAPADAHNERTD